MVASSPSYYYCCCLLLLVLPAMSWAVGVPNKLPAVEGDEYLLDCGGSGALQYFLLHQKGDLLGPGYHETLQIHVYQNASVYFESVSIEHEGTHLCIRGAGEASQAYPTPLKVRPLPPDDLWGEVYETKFVTGFLAALVVAALFILGCLVHKYRWRPAVHSDEERIISKNVYDNPAMAHDDSESGCSTKM